MLKLSPTSLQPRVSLQHQDVACLSHITDHWGWLNHAVVSLKASIPSASGHDGVSDSIELSPQLCLAAGLVTDLLNPGINVTTVLREVNLPWV